MTARARRLRNIAVLTVIGALIAFVHAVTSAGLQEPAFFSGWLLLFSVLLLIFLNVRKKVPFLPLSSVNAWLQFHIYIGWLSIGLFVLHIQGRVPDGPLEVTLAIMFLLVALSGIVGLFFSVSIPKRLTRRGEEVIFERIPAFRKKLEEQAEDLVVSSVEDTDSTTISDFYASRLKALFEGPKNFVEHLFEMRYSQFAVRTEIESVERYLNDNERLILNQLSQLVERKHDLDYHFTLQVVLKGWLFVHIPLTYSMLILALVHLVLAYAFTGGTGG